jgi:hypothetical protein
LKKYYSSFFLLFILSLVTSLTPCVTVWKAEMGIAQDRSRDTPGFLGSVDSSQALSYRDYPQGNLIRVDDCLSLDGPSASYDTIPLTDEISLVKEYFPVYRFSMGEKWFPCSFYFDGKGENYSTDLLKKDSYDSYTPWPPPYYAYVHVVETKAHVAIQYWLYYVWNQHAIWPSHYTDWDSTMFIILNKTSGEPTPFEIYYSHHLSEPCLSWLDWPGFENGTHPIVYVALGSHGAYPTQHMEAFDEWQLGGITLGLGNFSWYLVGDSVNHAHSYYLDQYCNMTVDWIEGQPQWEFDRYYWPRQFPQHQPSQDDPLGSPMASPWHRPEWMRIRPDSRILSFTGSPIVNIGTTDPSGLHIGYNSSTAIADDEVQDGYYSGSASDSQVINIQSPIAGLYTTDLIGTGNGNYTITVQLLDTDDHAISENALKGMISVGEAQHFVTQLFENGTVLTWLQGKSPWVIIGAAVSSVLLISIIVSCASWLTTRKRKLR